jgi:hypothetical protein
VSILRSSLVRFHPYMKLMAWLTIIKAFLKVCGMVIIASCRHGACIFDFRMLDVFQKEKVTVKISLWIGCDIHFGLWYWVCKALYYLRHSRFSSWDSLLEPRCIAGFTNEGRYNSLSPIWLSTQLSSSKSQEEGE